MAHGEALKEQLLACEHVIEQLLGMTLGGSRKSDPSNPGLDAPGGLCSAPSSLMVGRGLARGALFGTGPAILAA